MSNQPPPFAEYPRPAQGSSGSYGRGPGVYFEAIGESFHIVKADLGTWIAAAFVYFVAAWGLSAPINLLTQSLIPAHPTPDQTGTVLALLALQFILTILVGSISTVLMVGMVAMGVKKVRGEYINVGMIFDAFKSFGNIFGSSLTYYLIVFASALACILPSFYFAPVLYLIPVVAHIKGVGPMTALSLTFEACRAHWAGLLGLFILSGIVASLGVCLCFVGIFVTWPMFCVIWAIHYRAFFESAEPVATFG